MFRISPSSPITFCASHAGKLLLGFHLPGFRQTEYRTEPTSGCRLVSGWLSLLTIIIIKPLLLCIFKSPSVDSSRSKNIYLASYFIHIVKSNWSLCHKPARYFLFFTSRLRRSVSWALSWGKRSRGVSEYSLILEKTCTYYLWMYRTSSLLLGF